MTITGQIKAIMPVKETATFKKKVFTTFQNYHKCWRNVVVVKKTV